MGRHAVRYRDTLPCQGHLCALGTCEGHGAWFGPCGGCCRCLGGCLTAGHLSTKQGIARIDDVRPVDDHDEASADIEPAAGELFRCGLCRHQFGLDADADDRHGIECDWRPWED